MRPSFRDDWSFARDLLCAGLSVRTSFVNNETQMDVATSFRVRQH
jgi:hypothetical protein